MSPIWIVVAIVALVATVVSIQKSEKKDKKANEESVMQKQKSSDMITQWITQMGWKEPALLLVTEEKAVAVIRETDTLYYGAPNDPQNMTSVKLQDIRDVRSYNQFNGELISLWLQASNYEAGIKPAINKKGHDEFAKRKGEPLYGIKLIMKSGEDIDVPCYHIKIEGLNFKKKEGDATVQFAEDLRKLVGNI